LSRLYEKPGQPFQDALEHAMNGVLAGQASRQRADNGRLHLFRIAAHCPTIRRHAGESASAIPT
jgi:hypothetical protein